MGGGTRSNMNEQQKNLLSALRGYLYAPT